MTELEIAIEVSGGAVKRLRRGFSDKVPCAVETEARRQLAEYFDGRRKNFELPLKPDGTEFELAVWEELIKIPYGETVSYGEIARRIGKPAAVRAAASAVGRNPIPIIIPCHRVIRSDGSIGGFAWGLDVKRHLLAIEGVDI